VCVPTCSSREGWGAGREDRWEREHSGAEAARRIAYDGVRLVRADVHRDDNGGERERGMRRKLDADRPEK